ncbi:uncharacterized protein LOC129774474 [Toxorhynchites rutilus septentrionalis]|uniref:uncharacterized protein LOC129774474 n=1 Tax=Toxorhynchites rutilus septentrionalis TaxID=329112 RepID=UPI00247A3F29|nr:uncharacterized protein LOC129774474 [Toxorhynchites rutilus septentrionalis]
MSSLIKCAICEKIIAHNSENTGNLIQHLREFHLADSMGRTKCKDPGNNSNHRDSVVVEPESVPMFSGNLDKHEHDRCTISDMIDETVEPSEPSQTSSSEKEISPTTSRDCLRTKLIYQPSMDRRKRKVLYKRAYRPKKSFRSYRHVSYRTVVESWRPGCSRITCPACGKCRIPIVRSQQEHDTNSSAWASFLLFCWPFCCIPCCFSVPRREYLHCSVCDAHLASYDYGTDCLEPNFELFEGG